MDKLKILEQIEKGEITPDEGVKLIAESSPSDQKEKRNNGLVDEMQILEKIDKGDITIEDGLNELHGNSGSKRPKSSINENGNKQERKTPISDEELQKWRNWWTIPVFVGFVIVILSALWMNSAYENSGGGFWFIFSWIPLLLGIATMALSWPSPNRTWLHVRVKQAKGHTPQKIAISTPMPLNLISWGLKIAKRFAPIEVLDRLEDSEIEDLILGIGKSASNGTPFYVEVDEGDGEKVEVYFG